MKGDDEYDVFAGWRHILAWCRRTRATHRVKQRYSRRVRRLARIDLSRLNESLPNGAWTEGSGA